jgi:hypothetical protein
MYAENCEESEAGKNSREYGKMGYLFMHGPEDYRRQKAADRHPARNKQQHPDKADPAVVAAFLQLQAVWRRHGTHREEREVWNRLVQDLMRLPPPGT